MSTRSTAICLADKLTPRQFAELAGLDYEAAQVVYAAYAAENESYGELVGNIATYKRAAHRHVPVCLR